MSHSDLHTDDELLAARALGEPVPAEVEQHLQSCAACREELDRWRSLVSVTREASDFVIEQPPPSVWSGVSQQLQMSSRPRRRWSTSLLAAASVAGVLVGTALTLGVVAITDDQQVSPAPVASGEPTVIAAADLSALPKHGGSGDAEIVRTQSGRELVVDVSNLSSNAGTADGFYEVWLIDPTTFEMVGLGALNGASGRFPIPDGLDLRQYRVVDVSLEPYDGDPLHSRDSVIRGELPT